MLKRILVALSGTPYTPVAVEHAVELARLHDSEITGVTVTDIGRLAYVGSVPVGAIAAAHDLAEHRIQNTQERVEKAIAEFNERCDGIGVRHCAERETGDPLDELMSLWRYHDLTIFGLRGLFEYGVVHNPDDMLLGMIRHGVRPLLAVTKAYRPIKKVLIAYSGSMESAKAMKRFVQSRLWPDVTIRIAYFGKPDKGEQLLADATAYCASHGYDVQTEVVPGGPRQDLLPYAGEHATDLIVMGSTSRMRLFQHVLGDTVLTVIRESNIPVYLTQ